MAGHETTAKSLTWTLYLLDQHPEIQQRLREELATIPASETLSADHIAALPFTWMVLQEAMRLFPPVWLMSRICQKDDIQGDYLIKAGTLVIISPYTLHRHPNYWENPQTFDPDRFLPPHMPVPYSYFPFSMGLRVCIGQPFAQLETILVLATILRRFQLKLAPNTFVVPEALVTLRPKGGLPMILEAADDPSVL
jgi:cytochrome P450